MFKRILFTVFLLLPATQLVLAHDTWIEKRNGQLLVLRGHHGGTIEAYDPALVKEPKALDAKGQAVEMEIVKNKENAALSPKGKPSIVGALYDSGYWLKTTDGWKKATKREGHGTYTIVESLKGKQWCKSFLAPSAESSKPLGQGFEVVPQKDPATSVGRQASHTSCLRWQARGRSDDYDRRRSRIGQEGPTQDGQGRDGKCYYRTAPAYRWSRQATRFPAKDDPDADVLSLSSTITFDTH